MDFSVQNPNPMDLYFIWLRHIASKLHFKIDAKSALCGSGAVSKWVSK